MSGACGQADLSQWWKLLMNRLSLRGGLLPLSFFPSQHEISIA
jgi:hypothetical protein